MRSRWYFDWCSLCQCRESMCDHCRGLFGCFNSSSSHFSFVTLPKAVLLCFVMHGCPFLFSLFLIIFQSGDSSCGFEWSQSDPLFSIFLRASATSISPFAWSPLAKAQKNSFKQVNRWQCSWSHQAKKWQGNKAMWVKKDGNECVNTTVDFHFKQTLMT